MLGGILKNEKKVTNKNKNINLDKIDTLIGKNVKIEGSIIATGTVRLDCEFLGDVRAEGLIIGETGKIKGNIECYSILNAGIVEGSVVCKYKMRIKENGSQIGDVQAETVIIDEGAKFEGRCEMIKENPDIIGSTIVVDEEKN